MTVATVLVPTHDHGPTLLRAVHSALAQTVEDLEFLVVGDGVPDTTREFLAELVAADERVRFFDNPKGPRHGELHRHAALAEAGGEIVCYLSDDDLWLPDHVEEMRDLLSGSDFAHALPLWIDAEGLVHHYRVDLGLDYWRERLLGGENRIPFSCGAHTLELYRRLPAGWRPAPEGMPTDLYMWQQILSLPGCRAVSGSRPSVLNFPSPARQSWSREQRLAELDEWSSRLSDPEWRLQFAYAVVGSIAVDAAVAEQDLRYLETTTGEEGVRLRAQHDELQEQLERVGAERARLSTRLGRVDADLARLEGQLEERDRDLAALSASVTWRLRAWLVSLPGLGGLLRWAARALAGRARP